MTASTPGLPYITAQKEHAAVLFKSVSEAISALSEPDRAALQLRGIVLIPAETYLAVSSVQQAAAHSDVSGRSFRQHPVSYSGVSGHLRIVAA